MKEVLLGEIWGVGRKNSEHVDRVGIKTVGDVFRVGGGKMHEHLGVLGERLYFELAGLPSIGKMSDSVQQSIVRSRSFGKKTSARTVVEDAVSYHISHTALTLRKNGWEAGSVALYLRFKDEEERPRSISYFVPLPAPTSSTPALIRLTLETLRSHFNSNHIYVKAGVTLGSIRPKGESTLSLFPVNDKGDNSVLMKTFDAINRKHGSDTLRVGTLRHTHEWRSRSAFLSKSYTTSWTELPTAGT